MGANNRGPVGESRGGRAKGVPNRDKIELRAASQEAVLSFTDLRRSEVSDMWFRGWRWNDRRLYLPEADTRIPGEVIPPAILDRIQPRIEGYDPVVELALIAVDYRNPVTIRRQASADAAQYLRAKLKSIELTGGEDMRDLELQRSELTRRMFDLLNSMAKEKKLLAIEEGG